jgi:hypothetical protein
MALSLVEVGQMTGQKPPEAVPLATIADEINASGQHGLANALLAKAAWLNKEAQEAAPGVENPKGSITTATDLLSPDLPSRMKLPPHSVSGVQLDRLHSFLVNKKGLEPQWEPPSKKRRLKPQTTRAMPVLRHSALTSINGIGELTLESPSLTFCEALPLPPEDRKALQQEFQALGRDTLKDILMMPAHEMASLEVSPNALHECMRQMKAVDAAFKEKGLISYTPVGDSDRGR